MSQNDAPETNQDPEKTFEPSPARLLVALALTVAITFPVGILTMSHFRSQAWEARAETLTEKYGVEIESVDPVLRDAEPVTWRIEGTERECILSKSTDTLRCDDGTGTFVEVGR